MTQRECTYNELRQELFLRQREEGSIVWRTKAGEVIPIKDLGTEHLANIIAMLDRRSDEMEHIGDMDPMDYYD